MEGMGQVKEILKPLAEDGAALTREQAAGALEEILSGAVPDVETAALLTVMATRGEQAAELAGFVQVMRERMTPLPLTDAERDELVDVVGTGGAGQLGKRFHQLVQGATERLSPHHLLAPWGGLEAGWQLCYKCRQGLRSLQAATAHLEDRVVGLSEYEKQARPAAVPGDVERTSPIVVFG